MPAACIFTEAQLLLHMTEMESVLAPGCLDMHRVKLSRRPSMPCMSFSLQAAQSKLPLL